MLEKLSRRKMTAPPLSPASTREPEYFHLLLYPLKKFKIVPLMKIGS